MKFIEIKDEMGAAWMIDMEKIAAIAIPNRFDPSIKGDTSKCCVIVGMTQILISHDQAVLITNTIKSLANNQNEASAKVPLKGIN